MRWIERQAPSVANSAATPMLTGASHAQLSGALDWLALIGAALGFGILGGLIAWPPLQLRLGRA